MRTLAVLTLLGLMVLPACDRGRGTVESAPGETPDEMEAAGEVLDVIGDSVPLIRVRVSAASGIDQRQTVGVVVGERRRILCDAAALSLATGTGDEAEIGHTRSIEAVFHPGRDNERRYPAEVVREAESGMALLTVEGDAPAAVPLGDDMLDGARVFLIGTPLRTDRLVAETGTVRGYSETESGRFLTHTAGRDAHGAGPVFSSEGALVGLQLKDNPGDRMAIPAVEIAQWLQMPASDEPLPDEPGQVLERLLRQMDVQYHANEDGTGYVVSRPSDIDLLVRQIEGIISVEVDLGTLHVGDAIEALRSNYSDPVGAYALKPEGDADRLVWVARLPANAANASYLEYIARIGVLQTTRWEQIAAGLEPGYPYEHYPGGEEDEMSSRLAEVIRASEIPHEASGDGHKLEPLAEVPVYASEFHGMAYVYAYSGGMAGDGEGEQDQVSRALLRRNWEMPLGRLSLDRYRDLAWEAHVPIEHLTASHLSALVRVAQREVARLEETWGEIPFNEQ